MVISTNRSRLTLRLTKNGKITLQTINGPIVIEAIKSGSGGTDLCFEAPRDVSILRDKLLGAKAG